VHQGHYPRVLAKAREYARLYELGMVEPLDPPALRRMKLEAWYKSEERRERRRMKKLGMLADWERQTAQIVKEQEARRRALRDRLGPAKFERLCRDERQLRDWMQLGGFASRQPCPVPHLLDEENQRKQADLFPDFEPEPPLEIETQPTRRDGTTDEQHQLAGEVIYYDTFGPDFWSDL